LFSSNIGESSISVVWNLSLKSKINELLNSIEGYRVEGMSKGNFCSSNLNSKIASGFSTGAWDVGIFVHVDAGSL
jgi:hypothetical protein